MRSLLILCLTVLAVPAARAADAIELFGKGVQIYACTVASETFAWKLTGPDAILTDARGRVAGRHFAGPSWQATDGSTVVGQALASSDGAAGAVPWLVLLAKSHAGDGVFATVRYVTRTDTVGGVAPAVGCDHDHVGGEARVPYRATYTFFPTPPP